MKNQIDFKHFKKAHEDAHSATLVHKKGHKLVIAKKSLSEPLKKQLSSLPMQHFDEGGMSQPVGPVLNRPAYNPFDQLTQPIPADQQYVPQEAPQQMPEDLNEKFKGHAEAIKGAYNNLFSNDNLRNKMQADFGLSYQPSQPEDDDESAPQAPAPHAMASQPQMAAQATDPFGTNAYSDNMGKALDLQQAGILGGAQAESALGQREAGLYGQMANHQQDALKNYQDSWNKIEAERTAALKDYQNGHINPNHYLENMGTGKKIATAIGLILGGAGAGMTHTENPVEKFLHDQIERDVQSQVADMNQKHNLVSAYTQQFGNLKDATDMARLVNASIYGSQLQQAAAQSKSPLAQAQAAKTMGSLYEKYAPIMSQLAIRHSLSQGQQGSGIQQTGMGGGSAQQIDPTTKLRMLQMSGIIPKEEVSEATKELEKSQEIEKLRGNVEEAAKDLDRRPFAGALTPGAKAADMNTYAGILAKIAEGRFNMEESKQQMASMMPASFDSQATRDLKTKRRNEFFDSLSTTPTLAKYGIEVPRAAQANPMEGKTATNAQGQRIMMKNGQWVPYGQ